MKSCPPLRFFHCVTLKLCFNRPSEAARQAYKVTKTKDILSHPEFDITKKTLLYIGDCFEVNDESTNVIVNAYKKRGGYNIITLEWYQLSKIDFFSALIPQMNDVRLHMSGMLNLNPNRLAMQRINYCLFLCMCPVIGQFGSQYYSHDK